MAAASSAVPPSSAVGQSVLPQSGNGPAPQSGLSRERASASIPLAAAVSSSSDRRSSLPAACSAPAGGAPKRTSLPFSAPAGRDRPVASAAAGPTQSDALPQAASGAGSTLAPRRRTPPPPPASDDGDLDDFDLSSSFGE